jgi:hypothetical protein
MKPTWAHVLPGLVLVLAAGCSTSPRGLLLTWSAEDKAARPAGEVRASDPKTAQTPPERNGRERAAEALYRLGLLQADPTSGIRDYRAARATFTRLLSDYPRCRWGAEARAWQATLTDLLVREDEARRALLQLKRYEDESKRTKTNLEWLKQTDIELERRGR